MAENLKAPVTIPERPGWTLVFIGRKPFEVELLWRENGMESIA